MPVICRFDGLRIEVRFGDHLPPHFHALHGGVEVLVEMRTGVVRFVRNRRGRGFPSRLLAPLDRWREKNLAALLRNWDLAAAGQPLEQIPPPED